MWEGDFVVKDGYLGLRERQGKGGATGKDAMGYQRYAAHIDEVVSGKVNLREQIMIKDVCACMSRRRYASLHITYSCV